VAGAEFLSLWTFRAHSKEYERTRRAQLHELSVTLSTLKQQPDYKNWDAAVFLSSDLIGRTLKELIGSHVNHADSPNLELYIDDIKFSPEAGRSAASLALHVKRTGSNALTLRLKASAIILLEDIAIEPSSRNRVAKFRIAMLSIRPAIGFQEMMAVWGSDWDDILSSALVEAAADKLVFRVPMQFVKDLPLIVDETRNVEANEGKSQIPVRVSSPLTLPISLHSSAPIHAKAGIWLIGSFDGIEEFPSESVATDRLSDAIQDIQERIGKATTMLPAVQEDVWLRVGRSGIDRLVGSFNGRPDSERSISAETGEGTILEKIEKLAVVGNAGVRVNLKPSHATLKIGQMQTSWDEQGLVAHVTTAADGILSTNVRVDPGPGGGFNFDLKLDVAARNALDVRIRTLHVPGNAQLNAATALGIEAACSTLTLEGETRGEVKLGGRFPVTVGETPVNPAILVEGVPWSIELATSTSSLSFTPAYQKLGISLRDIDVQLDPNGITFQTDVELAVLPKMWDETKSAAERSRVEDVVLSQWKASLQKECPRSDAWRISVAGLEIGPNGEILKAIVHLAHTIGVTADKIKTVLKDPSDLPDVLNRTGQRAGAEAERVKEKVADTFAKAFGW
jgi:hypothetical protein